MRTKTRVWFARTRAVVWALFGAVSFAMGWSNSVALVWFASVYANVESGIASGEAADDSKIMRVLNEINDRTKRMEVPRMAQPESKLSRDIMAALRARGIWCMKIHGGPTMMAGAPDIIACVPVTVNEAVADGIGLACEDRTMGLFVGFETKTPTGGDPSAIQQRVHDNIRASSGMVFVPRSVQDAIDAIETLPGYTGTEITG